MKKYPTMFRQGDVLIVMVAALAADARKREREKGRVVLAHGEVTGHAHAIERKDVVHYDAPNAEQAAQQLLADAGFTFEVTPVNAPSFLEIPTGAEVLHEEHGTVVLPAGFAVAIRQREWTDADEPRQIAD
jgi:pyruvate/2-oxoglutarate dehydrogenase complex dihydrolipoamide acyltransferase (E2) component